MTVRELTTFNHLEYDDYIVPCAEDVSMGLVDCALWEAYGHHCGHSPEGRSYCKKSLCSWPLDKRLFYMDCFGKYYKAKYGTFENYKNSSDYLVSYIPDDDIGMCQLYSLLDNFGSYYDIFSYRNYLIILSVGSSYTNKDWHYSLEKLSEGFAVVINVALNLINLVALGEDDGNYWAEKLVPYENLCIYDRGVVCSMVNDIDSSKFWNKDKLIEKLIYGKRNV